MTSLVHTRFAEKASLALVMVGAVRDIFPCALMSAPWLVMSLASEIAMSPPA